MKQAIPYTPRWQGPIQGHAVNSIRKFYPSLCAEHEFEDLLQEAYIVFLRVKVKYPQVDDPRWFMRLFSRSLYRELIDLKTACHQTLSLDDPDVEVTEPCMVEDYVERIVLSRLPQAAVEMARQIVFGSGQGCERLLRQFRAAYAPRFVKHGTRYRLMER